MDTRNFEISEKRNYSYQYFFVRVSQDGGMLWNSRRATIWPMAASWNWVLKKMAASPTDWSDQRIKLRLRSFSTGPHL